QLTRDRPAAEDHTALVAGDERPAVRGSVHADPQSSPCPVHALALRHLASGPPQRPTIGSLRVRSARPSEDDSCHGTLVTMTPRSYRSRDFRRNALWLCRTCSHQRPTTYSGMYTITTSRGDCSRNRVT